MNALKRGANLVMAASLVGLVIGLFKLKFGYDDGMHIFYGFILGISSLFRLSVHWTSEQ